MVRSLEVVLGQCERTEPVTCLLSVFAALLGDERMSVEFVVFGFLR
jgi:hypothetical protein